MQVPTSTFALYTHETKAEIEAALERYTEFDGDCPDRLREAIRYSLLAPGKRLRPLLVLMAAEVCGCDREAALPAACAVEMIHAYSLIHDDLPAMDDDDLRRGLPTCHVAFGEAMAILAGDALLTRAFEILGNEIEPDVSGSACVELARAAGASGMVGGQVDDLDAESRDGDLQQLEAIHRRKTAALIRVSLRLGAIVARADAEQVDALDTYGRKLGLAFQITDDLLDIRGDQDEVGKRIGKDTGRGKLTFPVLLGVEESSQRSALLIDEAEAALSVFGSRASQLKALARFVLERNR